MKRKTFSLVLVVSMLVAILTIGVGISVLEAGDYCGTMSLQITRTGAFSNPAFPVPTGVTRYLSIDLQPAGPSLFTVTGYLRDELTSDVRSIPSGIGNLDYDEGTGISKFRMSLAATEVIDLAGDEAWFYSSGHGQISLTFDEDNEFEEGVWWLLTDGYAQGPLGTGFLHFYTFGYASIIEEGGDYSKCFDFKRK